MDTELINTAECCRMTSLCRQEIWRRRRAGSFPEPVTIGRRVGYVRSEVEQWLKARVEERDARLAVRRKMK